MGTFKRQPLRQVIRQRGRKEGKELCLIGRYFGRWSGKEVVRQRGSQALEQACMESGMYRGRQEGKE